MKHAFKAFWHSSARSWRGVCVLLAVVLSASMLVFAGQQAPADGARHITQAQLLTLATTGFDAPPYALASDEPLGPWVDTTLPRAPVELRMQQASGRLHHLDETRTQVTWYKLTAGGPDGTPAPHYLYVPRWKSDGLIAVYGDGRLLFQSHSNSQRNGSERPLFIALDDFAGATIPHQIVIRMQHVRGNGGSLSSLWIGNDDAIGWRYRVRHWVQVEVPSMANSAWVLLGAFSFFVYMLRQRDPLYLYFFFIAALSYLQSHHDFAGSQRVPAAEDWFGWLIINAGFWKLATSHLFINHVIRNTQPWLTRAVLSITVLCGVLTMPLPGLADMKFASPLAFLTILLTAHVVFGMGFWRFWKLRSGAGMVLCGWGIVSIQSGVHDWLMRGNLIGIEGIFLNPYASIGAFFIFLYVMYLSYVDAHQEVERVNASLEQRLQARELQLTQNHEQLRAAEQRALLGQERQRMTQDMHDGLGSSLVSALRVVERGKLDAHQTGEVLRACIDDLKLAIDSMEVVDADLLLLLATLRFRMAPRLESAGLQLHWNVQDVPHLDWLTPGASLHILRILQEAFTNIIKHAQATKISVATATEHDGILVSVTNDGRGFDIAQAMKSGGKGLANQLRRAEAIGGKLHWQSSEAGTKLCLLLPITQPKLG
jgi:signal transduction histidine kinase